MSNDEELITLRDEIHRALAPYVSDCIDHAVGSVISTLFEMEALKDGILLDMLQIGKFRIPVKLDTSVDIFYWQLKTD